MTKRFEHFLHVFAKKKESQLAQAFKKEKYNENCKTILFYLLREPESNRHKMRVPSIGYEPIVLPVTLSRYIKHCL